MWYDEAVVYQIYPLGLCGAPLQNDGDQAQAGEHRILRVLDWVEHIKRLGATCVLFNPLFESDAHGYDTRDYNKVDCRLGTNDDLRQVCAALHAAGIKILFDGVFNHVGRGFWAFKDVQEKRWDSPYKDWFHISFDGNTNYNDGFWYEAWEGCNELVKLNLQNPAVKNYLFDVVRGWVRDYDIDGLRLDVAYCLDLGFLAELRGLADSIKPEFALVGETLHGDYNRWMNDHACHSVTNYECYKGLYSSFNTGNMHEISYSLNRQFGSEQWCLYTGKHLLSFVDNHDVTRIATILTDKGCLRPIYGLLFGMPGVPSVYYGSEWGMEGDKRNGDPTLRPAIEKPGDLAALLTNLSENDILFVDEIHRLNRSVEEILYPAMEDFAIDIIIGKGPSANSIRLDLPHFTLIGATTRAGQLSAPLRDRFGVLLRLELYTPAELAQIVTRSAGILGVPIEDTGAAEIAKRARGTPRIANRLLRRVRDFAQVRAGGVITQPVADQALTALEVDHLGLDSVDRRMLRSIIDHYGGGPVGLETLAATVGEEAVTLEDVYEPYLMQMGFLTRTPRGRCVTRLAYEHLGLPFQGQEQLSL